MRQPGQLFIVGHVKITGGIDPMDWLPEDLTGRDMPTSLSKKHRGALRDNGNHPFSQPLLLFAEVYLLVFDEQRWLAGHGYDRRVICVESQIDMVRR